MMPKQQKNANHDLTIDILFDSPLWAKSRLSARKRIQDVLAHSWATLPKKPKGITPELSITLLDDAAIQILNRDYRAKDKPTNVLSFPMFNAMSEIPPHSGDIPLGDIFIAFETIKREAIEQDKPLANHFTHMLVHGFLHLLGYDHMTDDEAAIMEKLEIKILKGLSIPNPYM